MSLLQGFKRFGGNLLDVARAIGEQQFSPIGGGALEREAGDDAGLARARYDQNFRAARSQAVRNGARFYEMNDIAGAAAQPQYDEDLMRAVQVADALKQRRDGDARREALLKHIEGSKDLTDEQRSLLSALPEDQQAAVLSKMEFDDPADSYSMTALGSGSALLLNKKDGKYEIVRDPHAVAALAGSGFSGDALDLAAEQYLSKGTLPTGISRQKGASAAILQRAAELAKSRGQTGAAVQAQIAANNAARKAMDFTQKQLSATKTAEGAMMAHFRNAIALSEKVDRSGIPVLDKWVQLGKKNVEGDPDVSAFHAAIETALLEYAKILSGGVQSAGQITEGARDEIHDLLTGANTHEQLLAVYDLIVRDAHAKRESIESELSGLHQGLMPSESVGGGGSPQESAAERFKRLYPNG